MKSQNDVLDDLNKEIEKEVETKKYSIDDNLLRKCEWVVMYKEGSLLSVEEVHRENAKRYRDCYILHNSLVDVIRLIEGNSDK